MSPLAHDRRNYWRSTLRLTLGLLLLWVLVTFVAAYFAPELNTVRVLGFPLGFYMSAQGALIAYVWIVWYYARSMNKLDREYGIDEGDEQ